MNTLQETNNRWEDFYHNALVVGLDIGVKGIGIWLRKGQDCLWAGTVVAPLPDAAPLRSRRLQRSSRRSRASRRHREFLLKDFCQRFGLPWVEINSDPFNLRYRALTREQGLASKEALVVCLRHIIRHRGYDYHRTRAVEGGYPWGEELKFTDACKWVKTTCCHPDLARDIRLDVADSSWSETQIEEFQKLLKEAENRYHEDPIRTHLEKHFKDKDHLREPARKENFPRELIEDHLEKICRHHAAFFGGQNKLESALHELNKILNYHRKEPGALAERRVKKCPFLPRLQSGHSAACALSGDPAVRRFKLLEFLATRTFVLKDSERRVADEALHSWLSELLEQDIRALADKSPRPDLKSLRRDFAKKAAVKLAPDNASHNKDYFEQLRDLLRPKTARLKARASLSAKAAELLRQKALSNGYRPLAIVQHLQDYFTWRKDVESGYGLYPQVELLLGRWHPIRQQWVVKGWLQRLLERPEIQQKTDGQAIPDYVVIECVGDIPRNLKEAKEIKDAQKERREFKDKLLEKYRLPDNATETEIKKALLFHQQGGRCPYTGRDLASPLHPGLQIDHIFPRERGGISEMNNLVLTHADTNLKKGKRTPMECLLDFPDQRKFAQKMQWNKTKQALFFRTEDEVPDWQNLTRVAQLARHLRREAARWLGIAGNPNEIARRIGTPSGFLTSVCRESWQKHLPEKNRANLRHHLWDAAVLSHIPPGPGMNLVQYGGIFYFRKSSISGQQPRLFALADYAPNVLAFEQQHAEDCLVFYQRRASTKQSRYDKTIYHLDGQGRLWVRKPLTKEGEPVKNLEKHLDTAGLTSGEKPALSRKQLENWLANHGQPLRLRNKSAIHAVRTVDSSESPLTLAAHKNRKGETIGFKKATESYLRLEIWRGPEPDKHGHPQFFKRLIPHPRNLKNFLQRGFHFKRAPKHMPAHLRQQIVGLNGAFGKVIDPKEPLRQQVCGSLPKYAKKIGSLAKGDLVRVPFDAKGEIALPPDQPYCRLWYRVRSVKTNGQAELLLAEFEDFKATPLKNVQLDRNAVKPSSPEVLAYLIAHCKKHDSPSDSHQRKS